MVSDITLHIPESCAQAKGLLAKVLPETLADPGGSDNANLRSIATFLEVREIVSRPVDVAGMVVPIPEGYVVILNEKDSAQKNRYTIAHELGHLVIARAKANGVPADSQINCTAFRQSSNDSNEERMCEAIAAEMLMPAEMFAAKVASFGTTLASVPRLASIFGTSITATTLRYWELLPQPALIIRWNRVKSADGVLAPDWQRRNEANGPRANVQIHKRRQNRWRFIGPESAYETNGLKTSNEVFSTGTRMGRKTVTEFHRYKTESMGFGHATRRFVMSVGYLDQRLTGY